MVKILLVKLKNLYIQFAWVSIMEKQNSNQNMKVEFNFGNFFSCPVNCKIISNCNLDRNLIMALLIMATCTVLFEKLYIT